MSGEDRRRAARGSRARLFFALWPPGSVRRELAALALALEQSCGGRAIPAERIHLTLAFLGATPRELIPRLAADAGRLEAPGFELVLDHMGYWRRNRVAWAGAARCPEALPVLVHRLARSIAGHGFRPDDRPCVPHITLVRNARRSPGRRPIEPLAWPVTGFALVESMPADGAPRYEILRQWPLLR